MPVDGHLARAAEQFAGQLRLQGRHPEQYPLSLRSQDLWERLPELIGNDCEYDRTGHLYCAFDTDEAERLAKYAKVSRANGIIVDDFDRAALAKRLPQCGSRREPALGIVHALANRPSREAARLGDHARVELALAEERVEVCEQPSMRRSAAGDVIVEVGQERVSTPADVARRVDELKNQGRKSGQFLLADKAVKAVLINILDRKSVV